MINKNDCQLNDETRMMEIVSNKMDLEYCNKMDFIVSVIDNFPRLLFYGLI